jgi:hypothetical protein
MDQGRKRSPDALLEVVTRLQTSAPAPGADDVLVALASLHELLDDLKAWEPLLIEAARAQGVSWSALAPVLGVTSRQAAERRYLRMRPHRDSTLTGEQRVQDTRDSRAGERAVAAWAREHAAELRELAARVSAVAGLSTAGRRGAKALRDSLGSDDAAELLAPLRRMHAHLIDAHDSLAAEVHHVGERTDRVRRGARARRR